MALPARDDQYISLTPTDSPVEDAEMDAGDVPPDQAEQEISRHVRGGLTKLPAVTHAGTSLVTQRSENALTQGPVLLWATRVPDSMIPLLWSMRSLGRPDAPIGI